MVDLLPGRLPPRVRSPHVVRARGELRARVALLSGCAQSVLAPEIHVACVDVLTRNGIEVETLERAGCCGALAHHAGLPRKARRFARRLIGAFRERISAADPSVWLATSAAGCGSTIKEYATLFSGEPEIRCARELAERSVDVSELLDRLGYVEAPRLRVPLRVVYQDACHLTHAQHVDAAPRRLLAQIDGLELVEPREAHQCCGSAGVYNLEEPEIARKLGERKADALLELEPDLVATGNVGCLFQLRKILSSRGSAVPVVHTFELLAQAYRDTPSD